LLDQVRGGLVPVSGELSNLILAATDHIKSMLQAAQGGTAVCAISQAALLERAHLLSNINERSLSYPKESAAEPKSSFRVWHILFRPDPGIFACGFNPLRLIEDLRELGDCQVEGQTDALPPLAEMRPETCYLWWNIRLTTEAGIAAIRDVFLFVEEGAGLNIEAETPVQSVQPALEMPVTPTESAKSSLEREAPVVAAQAQSREASVRVPATRLDRLVGLVGELVMNQSRLARVASESNSPEIAAPIEELERLVAELRDDILQIRMMPIGTIFGRFRRLVHDLSAQLGKEIELVTEGEDTELDKSILDQLSDPLIHLLRNSIDHGIELPAHRLAKGKPPQGVIRLAASHAGSDVVVTIEDDGKGMDRAAIRAKAVSKQIISSDASLTDKEILNLILLPGFSTAQSITSVSGRGVGMDVVKRQIDALRGSLKLESEFGKGSSVSLTLPLTLAIIEGLLVEAGDSQYIIPMPSVTENVELLQRERARNNGRNVIAVRGELVPYIDLRETFRMSGAPPPISKIVLVRFEDQRVGLVVDRVMGTHQTVIQPLGRFFRNIEVFSGSTIMGDGRVALILDVAGVVRLAGSWAQRFVGPSGGLSGLAA
jgi:two-component system chemotaxis sensor kinase CheA